MQIFLVRHGETVWNRQRRLQGRADSPLTLRGARLAVAYGQHLSEALAGHDLGEVGFFVSPLGRTRQTASLIADCLGLGEDAFEVDPLLAEHDVGALEGLVWQEIEARHGLTPASWREWDTRAPGGETRSEMFERASAWLARPRPCQTAVVVSHGGLSRTFRAAYLQLGPDERMALEPHSHGLMFELKDGRCTPHLVDDTPPRADAPLG
jgi:probable phosphoglycerate mutase